jgi:hypothetical protein
MKIMRGFQFYFLRMHLRPINTRHYAHNVEHEQMPTDAAMSMLAVPITTRTVGEKHDIH